MTLHGCLIAMGAAGLVLSGCASTGTPHGAAKAASGQSGHAVLTPERVAAINPKFGPYTAYLQRVLESVDAKWESLLDSSRSFPPSGSSVVVRFYLNADGKVVRFGDVDNRSSNWGAQVCTSAIVTGSPYGAWTDEMKADLNPEGEELVVTFYYQ